MARRHGIPCIGIGHQYAFCFPVPVAGGNPLSKLILGQFAPVDTPLGLHWDAFGSPILPPIVFVTGPVGFRYSPTTMEFGREVIKNRQGRVVGEIVRAGDVYQVWKKDPPSFPPRHRHTLIGTFSDLDEARQAAAGVEGADTTKRSP